MKRWIERMPVWTIPLLVMATIASPRGAAGQESVFERLNLDRLKLTSLGVAYGPVYPAKSEDTKSYGVTADYGEIARNFRIVFVVSYWGSEFTRDVVEKFVLQVSKSIVDSTGDARLERHRVTISDISLETDIRWSPLRPRLFQPYAGVGVGAHVINAESKLIEGTFVESALDNIGTGITGLAGVRLGPVKRIALGVEGRFTALSNVRFGTIRATGAFFFGPDDGTRRP
ncbi:MAG: outer membrane protein [Gemmatimonadaceae bacterium]